jgi:hypothetical protein
MTTKTNPKLLTLLTEKKCLEHEIAHYNNQLGTLYALYNVHKCKLQQVLEEIDSLSKNTPEDLPN